MTQLPPPGDLSQVIPLSVGTPAHSYPPVYWAPSSAFIQVREADQPQIGVSGHKGFSLLEGGDFRVAAATASVDDDTRLLQPSFVGSRSEDSATSGATEVNGNKRCKSPLSQDE
ncbi:uncharacterized protein SAPINGB_P000918 [Magnusiomyces paraingens]|uniref:Uncharacterized protein n=1 Tax=Magnusiomyces paraingens TaxID=2606893 RepID=A0A5E8B4T9_9ASCO|nr:uncharacterized protein SAPINGB_P000918 [Saprochaete ingens]VVT45842.1 unnamed protein product [Saprochaete ingens]